MVETKSEEYELTEEHDGIKVKKKKGTSLIITEYNFLDAINNEKDPRKIFLSGQLHLEFQCDGVIFSYFQTDKGLRNGVFSNFLHSEEMSFEKKIKLLGKLLISDKHAKPLRLIDKKITKGLRAIARIRNAFQHNLSYEEALKIVLKGGANFGMIDNKLKDCKDIDSLVKNFKEEYEKLYLALHDIIMSPELRDEDKISKQIREAKENLKK